MTGKARFTLCIISNKPDQLALNLPKYASLMTESGKASLWQILICDDSSKPGANVELLRSLSAKGIKCYLYESARLLEWANLLQSHLGHNVKPVFKKNYGGLRNSLLFVAAGFGGNVVFVDDDTYPLYDFFDRHEKLLSSGYWVIPGGFEGDVGLGAPSLLFEARQLFNQLSGGEISPADAAKILERLSRGNTMRKGSYSLSMFGGGNLGLAENVVKRIPFPPTSYRVEDVLFRNCVDFFARRDGGKGIYSARSYDEAYATLPLVQHERSERRSPCLYIQLVNELKGMIIADTVSNIGFDAFEKTTALDESELKALASEALSSAFYSMGIKITKSALAEGLKLVEKEMSPETIEDYHRVEALKKEDVEPTIDELKIELDSLSMSLRSWPYITSAMSDPSVRKSVFDGMVWGQF